ncbi:MAG TPA: YraN family protein [Devosiaceae bacterium]|jgi:putative endonuclease
MPRSPADRTAERLRAERLRAEKRGRRAEAVAALFLMAQLYTIAERRYRTPVGEIDLIAARFGTIVFVEVKTRATPQGESDAMEAVNAARLTRAAQYYLSRHPARAHTSLRFDVIFVAPFAWPRHLKNAFDAV